MPEGNSGARTRDVRGDEGIGPPDKEIRVLVFPLSGVHSGSGSPSLQGGPRRFIIDSHAGSIVEKPGERDLYKTQKAFFRDAYRSDRIGWPRTGASRIVRMAFERGYLGPGSRVLEIGCGEGRNLRELCLGDCSVVGMDYVEEPLQTAKRSLPEKATLVQGDLFFLPFREKSFDTVLDWGVFHHLKKTERERYPKWLFRLVGSGGVVLLGAFSEKFRHHPDEVRRQMFVRHRGHYDVFFDRERFSRAMGPDWRLVWEGEENQEDDLSHYRLGIFQYNP